MKKRRTKILPNTRLGRLLCLILFALLLLPGCGVYSKVPPVNPEEIPLWSGPLVDDADMEHVRIYIKPNQRTITLNMEDLDGDLRLLLSEYDEAKGNEEENEEEIDVFLEELSVNIPQSGAYVLVIEKTKP